MNHRLINDFINLLLTKEFPIPGAIIYHEITDSAFQLSLAAGELDRLGLIEMSYDRKGYEQYLITYKARLFLKTIPEEYKNDIYGYLLRKEQEDIEQGEFVTSLNHEKLKLEVSDLRNKFFDYDRVKNQAKWGLVIAAIAAIAAIFSLFF